MGAGADPPHRLLPDGPIDGDLHRSFLRDIEAGLKAAGKLDAVYIANHGGMIATDTDDPDGDYIEVARRVVGPDAAVVS